MSDARKLEIISNLLRAATHNQGINWRKCNSMLFPGMVFSTPGSSLFVRLDSESDRIGVWHVSTCDREAFFRGLDEWVPEKTPIDADCFEDYAGIFFKKTEPGTDLQLPASLPSSPRSGM